MKDYRTDAIPLFQWNLYISQWPSTITYLGQACKLTGQTGLPRSSYSSGRLQRNVKISLEQRKDYYWSGRNITSETRSFLIYFIPLRWIVIRSGIGKREIASLKWTNLSSGPYSLDTNQSHLDSQLKQLTSRNYGNWHFVFGRKCRYHSSWSESVTLYAGVFTGWIQPNEGLKTTALLISIA